MSLLTGHEHLSGETLRIVYTGHLESKNYIARVAFVPDHSDQTLGRGWRWKTPELENRPDVVVSDMERAVYKRFADRHGIYIPCWVGGEVRLAEAVARFEGGVARGDLQRFRRGNFQLEVTTSPERFDEFYHTMYLPHVRRIYGNTAFVEPYELVKSRLNQSELYLIKQGDEYVAGSIIVYEDKRVHWWFLGVKNGDRKYMRSGALAATHYLKSKYLAERGFRSAYWGHTRPFLNDGVLQYKKRWGLRLVDTTSNGFWLRITNLSSAAKAFLLNNPFIAEHNGHLVGTVFAEAKQLQTRADIRALWDKHYMPGLSGLMIRLFDRESTNVDVPDNLADQIVVGNVADLLWSGANIERQR